MQNLALFRHAATSRVSLPFPSTCGKFSTRLMLVRSPQPSPSWRSSVRAARLPVLSDCGLDFLADGRLSRFGKLLVFSGALARDAQFRECGG